MHPLEDLVEGAVGGGGGSVGGIGGGQQRANTGSRRLASAIKLRYAVPNPQRSPLGMGLTSFAAALWKCAKCFCSGSALLGDALKFPAQDPRQHEKNNQHEHAKTRESIAHELLRDLAKRMAN